MKISKANSLQSKKGIHPITQKKWTAAQILRQETSSKIKGGSDAGIIIVEKDLD